MDNIMDKSIDDPPPITNIDDTLPKISIDGGIYFYLFPLFLIYLLYHFRKYYKTHNIIYIFSSIIVILYIIFHYFVMKFLGLI